MEIFLLSCLTLTMIICINGYRKILIKNKYSNKYQNAPDYDIILTLF